MLNGDTVYATDSLAYNNHGGASDKYKDEADLVTEVSTALQDAINEEQLKVTLSDEGVVVDLMEADGAPLFNSGESVPSDLMRGVIERITPVLRDSGRPVKIVGHTDSVPFRAGSQFTNWELSAERANAARRMAVQYGLPYDLISEVVGKADKMPLVADRKAPENRRISIIMQNAASNVPPLEAR